MSISKYGVITGEGNDTIGRFEMTGNLWYDENDDQVRFRMVKSYPNFDIFTYYYFGTTNKAENYFLGKWGLQDCEEFAEEHFFLKTEEHHYEDFQKWRANHFISTKLKS